MICQPNTIIRKEESEAVGGHSRSMNNGSGAKLNNIKAPMPGLIIDLRVTTGQTIQPGDTLLILEAMNMENIIKSSGAGIVKRVAVKKGDSVEKGQVLIEF